MKKDLEDVFEEVPCNLCGSKKYKVIYEARYENETQEDLMQKFRAAGDETLIDQIVKCNKCGLIYVNPRIRGELILEGYSEGTDEAFVSQARGREITFEKQLKLINKHSPGKGRILDIGTAGGSFLYVAKKDGWDVHGVEPNKWMAEWGWKHYGIEIKPGDIFSNKYPSNYFDVVTLFDVLEHVPDPSATLKEINRIMKKEGLLIVNYPDIGSWVARIMGRKWVFILSVHLWYFTRKTIRKMLNRQGYEVVKIKPHFQSLSLGYLTHRTKAYSKFIGGTGEKVVKMIGLQDKQAKYWIGQTMVVARKKK